MRNPPRAAHIVRIEELPHRQASIRLPRTKLRLILSIQKRRLVMIKPPRQLRRRRVLEVDNRILPRTPPGLIKQRPCTMHQPLILKLLDRPHTLPMKPRKQRRRTSPIETMIMKKHPAIQSKPLSTTSSSISTSVETVPESSPQPRQTFISSGKKNTGRHLTPMRSGLYAKKGRGDHPHRTRHPRISPSTI